MFEEREKEEGRKQGKQGGREEARERSKEERRKERAKFWLLPWGWMALKLGRIEYGTQGQWLNHSLCHRFSSFTIYTKGINSLRNTASNTPASQTTQITEAKIVVPPPSIALQQKEEEWSNWKLPFRVSNKLQMIEDVQSKWEEGRTKMGNHPVLFMPEDSIKVCTMNSLRF